MACGPDGRRLKFRGLTPTGLPVGIVNPSAEISHGFEGTQVTLTDDRVIHGLMISSSDPLVVQSMGGVTQLIPADRVKKRDRMNRSLMLSAEQMGMGPQEIADLVAYLRGL